MTFDIIFNDNWYVIRRIIISIIDILIVLIECEETSVKE